MAMYNVITFLIHKQDVRHIYTHAGSGDIYVPVKIVFLQLKDLINGLKHLL